MSASFDVIVIGSGFGGAITACRLAERGFKVLVLERGRRWAPPSYPRRTGDPWFYSDANPEKQNGWLDLRLFPHMTVAQAAGVGGGSLSYSSVALEAHPSLFTAPWPAEITYAELKPYYDRVSAMMELQTLPDGQLTQRFMLAREAAAALGHADRVSKAPLAVTFSPDWNYQLPDPHDVRHSRTFVNAQGVTQGTCIHLGNCDIGCDVRAKNSLDVNYVPRAERFGAEVRPLHVVRAIEPDGGDYRVTFDRIDGRKLIRGEERARRVILAAGSLGSTELLLRCRDEHKTLPALSRRLGERWSANANVLSMARYADAARVQQTLGPTIAGVVDFMDGSIDGQRFVIEDDGFPNILLNALRGVLSDGAEDESGRSLLSHIASHVEQHEGSRNVMVWLGAGMDASDGVLSLERRPLTSRSRLRARWEPKTSTRVVEAILDVHEQMTKATGGRLNPNPAWSLFKSLVTLHPLGGCGIGDTSDTGVVDHLGRVFGYDGLFVADGAIVPGAIGRNPSHTIAALAERIAEHVRA